MTMLSEIQDKIKASSMRVIDYFKKNKPLAVALMAVVIAILILSMILVPKVGRSAKNKQIQSIVMSSYTNKKLHYIPYEEAKQTIAEKKSASVFFIDISDPNYEKIEKVLSNDKQLKAYKNQLYIYPIVHKNQKAEKDFNLTKKGTLIFFEDNKEVNRYELPANFNYEKDLITQLNSLPMANIKEITTPEKETESQTVTSSSMGDDSVILNNGTDSSGQ